MFEYSNKITNIERLSIPYNKTTNSFLFTVDWLKTTVVCFNNNKQTSNIMRNKQLCPKCKRFSNNSE